MKVPAGVLGHVRSALTLRSRDRLTLLSTEKVLTVASFDQDPSREFTLDPHRQSQGTYLAVISTSPKCNRCQLLASSQVTWLTSSGTFERPSATSPSSILYGPASLRGTSPRGTYRLHRAVPTVNLPSQHGVLSHSVVPWAGALLKITFSVEGGDTSRDDFNGQFDSENVSSMGTF